MPRGCSRSEALKMEIERGEKERGEKEREEASSDQPSEKFVDEFFYAFANYMVHPRQIDHRYYVPGPGTTPMPITATTLREIDIEKCLLHAKRIYSYLHAHREGIETEVAAFSYEVDSLAAVVAEEKGSGIKLRGRWRIILISERLRHPTMAPDPHSKSY